MSVVVFFIVKDVDLIYEDTFFFFFPPNGSSNGQILCWFAMYESDLLQSVLTEIQV